MCIFVSQCGAFLFCFPRCACRLQPLNERKRAAICSWGGLGALALEIQLKIKAALRFTINSYTLALLLTLIAAAGYQVSIQSIHDTKLFLI